MEVFSCEAVVRRFDGKFVDETIPYKLDVATPDVLYMTAVGRFDTFNTVDVVTRDPGRFSKDTTPNKLFVERLDSLYRTFEGRFEA